MITGAKASVIVLDDIETSKPWNVWFNNYQQSTDFWVNLQRSAFKLDPLLYGATREKEHELNYHFGSALHHVKHPLAKEYHSLSQAGKSKTRRAHAKKGQSKHPHMAKHHAAWKAYVALVTAASLGDS